MNRFSSRQIFLIDILLLLLISVALLFSIRIYKTKSSNYSNYKSENIDLARENEEIESKNKELKNIIEDSEKKIDEIESSSLKYNAMPREFSPNLDINSKFIKTLEPIDSNYSNNISRKDAPIVETKYFESDLENDFSREDMAYFEIFISDISGNLNSKIISHNGVFQGYNGLIYYYNTSNNNYLKQIILNRLNKFENSIDSSEVESILDEKKSTIDLYDQFAYSFIENSSIDRFYADLNREKTEFMVKDLQNGVEKYIDYYVFFTDLFSKNANYLNNVSVQSSINGSSKFNSIVDTRGRKLLVQMDDSNGIKTVYLDNSYNPYYMIEFEDFKEKNLSDKNSNEYNEALNIVMLANNQQP